MEQHPREVCKASAGSRKRGGAERASDAGVVGSGNPSDGVGMRFPFQCEKSEPMRQRKRGPTSVYTEVPFASSWWKRERGVPVEVCTTSDVAVCERWVRDFRATGGNCLGLDVEWKPNTMKRQKQEPVATLQLATERSVLILQVLYFDPDECAALADLLSDDRVLKLGVGIKDDLVKLLKDCNLHCAGGLDLSRHFKTKLGLKVREDIGLKRLASFVLGFDLHKPKALSRSNWSRESLSEDQIKYAALDAVVACRVFQRLRRLDNGGGGGRGQTEASSLDRMVISARTNLALRRSFAVRRAKQLPLFGRLCLFASIFLALYLPSLALVPQFLPRDVFASSWGLLSVLGAVHLWGASMYKYRNPLGQYFGSLSVSGLLAGLLTGIGVTGAYCAGLTWLGLGRLGVGPEGLWDQADALLIGLAIGFAQEVVFRGFLRKEVEKEVRQRHKQKRQGRPWSEDAHRGALEWRADGAVALIFAASHLSPQAFPGLALVSLCLSEGRRKFGGSLSYPIGLRATLVAANLIWAQSFLPSTDAAPWIVGFDAGPNSGLLGAGVLLLLLLGLKSAGSGTTKAN